MEMILLGSYITKQKKNLVLYSKEDGKCNNFLKPKDFDLSFYSYFNTLDVEINKFNKITSIEDLGVGYINSILQSIKSNSDEIMALEYQQKDQIIIYLEKLTYISELSGEYKLNFKYRDSEYSLKILDNNIVDYLDKEKINIKILNEYMAKNKTILVIRRIENMKIIIKMHSINMEMK